MVKLCVGSSVEDFSIQFGLLISTNLDYDIQEVHFPIKACYLKLLNPTPKYDKYTYTLLKKTSWKEITKPLLCLEPIT